IPDGNPIAGADVSILTPSGLPISGGTTNPTQTGSDGSATWEIELSPGPIEVSAEVSGADRKIGFGDSVFQIGQIFSSDVPKIMEVFNNGKVLGVGDEVSVTASASSSQVTVGTGRIIIQGHVFEIDDPWVVNIPENNSLPVRVDLL